MDNDSGHNVTYELRQLGWQEWEKEWSGLGWRNEAGSLFQRQGDAQRNEGSVIFKEEDDDGRERVTEEEEEERVTIKGESTEIKFGR